MISTHKVRRPADAVPCYCEATADHEATPLLEATRQLTVAAQSCAFAYKAQRYLTGDRAIDHIKMTKADWQVLRPLLLDAARYRAFRSAMSAGSKDALGRMVEVVDRQTNGNDDFTPTEAQIDEAFDSLMKPASAQPGDKEA